MEALLVKGSINKHLIRLTIPMIWGILAIMAFNLADTYFVAQLGLEELTAISFTFPIVMVYGNMGIGLSIGATSVISRMIGKGDVATVKRLATDSLVLSFLCVVFFVLIGFFTIRPLFFAMGANLDEVKLIESYMRIWYGGMPFLVIPMVGNGIIRALGDAKTPALIMTLSAVSNIILDPIMIFGLAGFPKLGLEGAAWATVLTRAITLIASLGILVFKYKIIVFNFHFREMLHSWKKILKIAIPTSATHLMLPLSISIITALVAVYGPEAVAAFGVVSKIESFCFIVLLALGAALGPFVGQNWGAKKYNRVYYAIINSNKFSFIWGIFIFLSMIFSRHKIVSLFNDNLRVIEIATYYLLLVSSSYAFEGMRIINSSFFNALGKPKNSILFIVFKMIVVYIPLAYLFSKIFGVKGIFIGSFTANIFVGIFSMLRTKKCLFNAIKGF